MCKPNTDSQTERFPNNTCHTRFIGQNACTSTFVYWMIWGYGNLAISINFKLKFSYYDFHLQKSTVSILVPDGTWRCDLSAFVYVRMLRFWASLVQSPVQQWSVFISYMWAMWAKKTVFHFCFLLFLFSNETVHSNLQIFSDSPFLSKKRIKSYFTREQYCSLLHI